MSIESDITALATAYGMSLTNWDTARDNFEYAADESLWDNARVYIDFLASHIYSGGGNIICKWGGETGYHLTNILMALNDKIDAIGSYELTMGDLLSTMLAATSDEITYFIGLVDAYRTSIWDKEFNHEFYAALARGFMP